MPPSSSASCGGNERSKDNEYLARMNVLWKQRVADSNIKLRYTQENPGKMPTKGVTEKEKKDFIAREAKSIRQDPVTARWFKVGKGKSEEEREILTIDNTVAQFHAAYSRDKGWLHKRDFTQSFPRTREGISRRDVEFLVTAYHTGGSELENGGVSVSAAVVESGTIQAPDVKSTPSKNTERGAIMGNSGVEWTGSNNGQYRPSSQDEKEARKTYCNTYDLCHYCESNKHDFEDCPKIGKRRDEQSSARSVAPSKFPSAGSGANTATPTPAAKMKPPVVWKGSKGGKFRPRNDAERAARKQYCDENHLCHWCESPEHAVQACPTRPKSLLKQVQNLEHHQMAFLFRDLGFGMQPWELNRLIKKVKDHASKSSPMETAKTDKKEEEQNLSQSNKQQAPAQSPANSEKRAFGDFTGVSFEPRYDPPEGHKPTRAPTPATCRVSPPPSQKRPLSPQPNSRNGSVSSAKKPYLYNNQLLNDIPEPLSSQEEWDIYTGQAQKPQSSAARQQARLFQQKNGITEEYARELRSST